jgi:hypothetical protein
MSSNWLCWQCKSAVTDQPLPLSTYAECRDCRAQLHCCRQCQHFNPRLRVDCDEPRAESHSEREKSNFCDWFKLRREFVEPGEKAPSVNHQTELNTLFGANSGVTETPSNSRMQLDNLFTAPSDDP